MKFIASSKDLWLMLEAEKVHKTQEDKLVQLIVENKNLYLSALSKHICVEAKEDGHFEMNRKQLKALRKVLKAIPHQPVVLYVVNHSLHIQNIQF